MVSNGIYTTVLGSSMGGVCGRGSGLDLFSQYIRELETCVFVTVGNALLARDNGLYTRLFFTFIEFCAGSFDSTRWKSDPHMPILRVFGAVSMCLILQTPCRLNDIISVPQRSAHV